MTFEQKLFDGWKPEAIAEFRANAQRCFSTVAGKTVLAELVKAAHPMRHSESMSAHEHGQCEVVATLWRFGSLDPVPSS